MAAWLVGSMGPWINKHGQVPFDVEGVSGGCIAQNSFCVFFFRGLVELAWEAGPVYGLIPWAH